jgi:putative oxidoreductase
MNPDTKNTWMDADVGKLDSLPHAAPIRVENPAAKDTTEHDLAFALVRIVFGLLIAAHGAQKLFGFFGGAQVHDSALLIAGSLEFVGGMAVAMGIFTRIMAFLLCGEMAVAYFKVHFGAGQWPIGNIGEVTILYCFFFLYVFMRGAGGVSIEALRRKG